jgi:hypothetical protein
MRRGKDTAGKREDIEHHIIAVRLRVLCWSGGGCDEICVRM